MSKPANNETPPANSYGLKISRRESLLWLGTLMTSAAIPGSIAAPLSVLNSGTGVIAGVAAWPALDLAPIIARGYGKDPQLITPAPVTWPLTLTRQQLELVAVLADIIVPAEGDVPSASAVGVPEVINEWVSAPYELQQQHRQIFIPGLAWVDAESTRRFGKTFVHASAAQQLEIVDAIAFSSADTPADLQYPVMFFDGLRQLVTGAFFTSPEGMKDLGYMGGVPLQGDYPGPTPEAMNHLRELTKKLGLSL